MIEADILLCDIYRPYSILALRDAPDNFQWYTWFREHKLEGITYCFCYKNIVLKYGCSYANFQTRNKQNTSYGERLIRQIKNLPGRAQVTPTDTYLPGYGFVPASEHGADIRQVIIDFEEKIKKKISRDEIYLHIWNITNAQSTKYFFPADDNGNKRRAEYFEGLMVAQYKQDNNGVAPIGNIKDPSVHNHAFVEAQIAREAAENFIFY